MRRAGQISQTTIEILIVIGIIVVLNVLGQYFYARLDLTKEKQYTLAPSSKKIVASLPDLVHIKVYVSSDLPPQVQQAETNLTDLLEEYRAAATNNLTIQIIHTNDLSAEELTALEQKGIEKQTYRQVEQEQAQMQNVYMGLEIDYLDKSKVIGFAPTVQNLEYEITAAILKLTMTTQPMIGFLTGHGEGSTQQDYDKIIVKLKDLYNVQDVDLGTGTKVPDGVTTLVIAGPTQAFTPRHRYVIDQFLMRGGKLIVLQPGCKLNEMSRQAEMQMAPLEAVLATYGLKVNNDLAIDLDYNLPVPAGTLGGMQVSMPYPPIPVIRPPNGFPSDSPATRGLDSLIFPWVSSIQLLYDKIPKETQIQELAKTSARSYSHPLPLDLSPQSQFAPPGGESDLKPQLVAVQLNGVFRSAFQGQAVPAMDLPRDAAEGTIPQMDTEAMIPQSPQTSIVLIGNSAFIEDQAADLPGDQVFFLNLMEELNLGDQLIDIRTRTVTSRPLAANLTPSVKNGLRFWGYGAVPIIVTLFGVARFYLKTQRKRLLQAMQYAEKSARKEKGSE